MLCKFACVSCGREVFREIEDDAVDYMYDVYASYIKCSPCMEAADREWGERQEAERRRREAAANAELAERRLKASGLLKYEQTGESGTFFVCVDASGFESLDRGADGFVQEPDPAILGARSCEDAERSVLADDGSSCVSEREQQEHHADP